MHHDKQSNSSRNKMQEIKQKHFAEQHLELCVDKQLVVGMHDEDVAQKVLEQARRSEHHSYIVAWDVRVN